MKHPRRLALANEVHGDIVGELSQASGVWPVRSLGLPLSRKAKCRNATH